jgi:hypothetical protein
VGGGGAGGGGPPPPPTGGGGRPTRFTGGAWVGPALIPSHAAKIFAPVELAREGGREGEGESEEKRARARAALSCCKLGSWVHMQAGSWVHMQAEIRCTDASWDPGSVERARERVRARARASESAAALTGGRGGYPMLKNGFPSADPLSSGGGEHSPRRAPARPGRQNVHPAKLVPTRQSYPGSIHRGRSRPANAARATLRDCQLI